MTGYQEMHDNYRAPQFRERAEMCVREQGLIFANDGRPQIAALGIGVTGGNWSDIEAIMAAVASGTNGTAAVTDDGALLSAVQSVWPTVAAARYPGAALPQVIQMFGPPPVVQPVGDGALPA